MKPHLFGWAALGVCLAVVHTVAAAAEPLPVFVSIAPQKFFVQQIGKEMVAVHVMVAPGASPHAYEPRPRQMTELSKTKLYFAIGVTFEKAWLKRIAATNPGMQVVHTDHGIQKISMPAHHHQDDEPDQHDKTADHHHQDNHSHDHDHHNEQGLDPHIWLSPPLVKLQARTILEALKAADPDHRSDYEDNYHQFISEVDHLDHEMRAIFAGTAGLPFMVFHPAWGYFADAYGLKQVAIEMEGKDPKPAQLQALIEQARAEGIRVIFVQPQFSSKSAELVAREIDGQVAFADPLAEDWAANLRGVAEKFRAALK